MATPAEIANDLLAQAALMNKRGFNPETMAASLRRAAECIRELSIQNQILAENTTVTAIVTLGATDDD